MGLSKIEASAGPVPENKAYTVSNIIVIAKDVIVSMDPRPNRRRFLVLSSLFPALLVLAACSSPDVTPAASPTAAPATARPNPSEQFGPEQKKEAIISLTAERIVPDCLLAGESANVEVRAVISGKGLTINNNIIQVHFTVLRGDGNSVTIISSNNEEIVIPQGRGWAAPLGIQYKIVGSNETGTAEMPPIPLLKYQGLNTSNQFCFEAPKILVQGSPA